MCSMLPAAKRCAGILGLALAGSVLNAFAAVQAADFDEEYRSAPRRHYESSVYPRGPVYAEPRYAPPAVERQVEVEDGLCRVFHRRRIDPYGRETIHRVRVCDEGVVRNSPYWIARAPNLYRDRRGYDVPRPPRAVGPDFED